MKTKRKSWRTKVVHCQKDPYDFLIDRSTPFGNPWSHKNDTLAQFKVATRLEALKKFKEYLLSNKELQERLKPMKGKTLGCWCKPDQACHGDIIADFLDGYLDPPAIDLSDLFGLNLVDSHV